MSDSQRFLGIELSGAKNDKTALAVLEYYPRESKVFLLDLFERVAAHDEQSADEALLEVIEEHRPAHGGLMALGLNVPLTLPPCITCTRKTCPLPDRCTVPTVRAMRTLARKGNGKPFTPYTQRPVELWLKNQVLTKLPEAVRFDVDEALGGSRAPLAARAHFLKRHLSAYPLYETLPKLTVAVLAQELGLNKRLVATYRHLEDGVHSREEILAALARERGVFVYERDVHKLAVSLASFDAFLCAYAAWLATTGQCTKAPASFPQSSGWIQYPKLD